MNWGIKEKHFLSFPAVDPEDLREGRVRPDEHPSDGPCIRIYLFPDAGASLFD